MENGNTGNRNTGALRKRALEMLHENPAAIADLSGDDVESMAHELSVYQIELEMQNEQLRDAQVELERSRQEYLDIYDFAPAGYITLDTNGIIQRANLTATTMLEVERANLIKHPFSKFIVPEDMDIYYLHRQKILETKEQQECELRIKKKDDSISWFYTQCRPVMNGDGQVSQIRSVMTDITEKKLAENQRKELVKLLEFKNRELQDIVYTASHDLRSPLVNIQGFSGELKLDCDNLQKLLAKNNVDNDNQVESLIAHDIPHSLSFIVGSAKKMVSLLNGLLQVSRIGAVKIDHESIDINEAMKEILVAMEYKINENGIAVTVGPLVRCIGDKHMIDHIFTNLIGNAIKYMDPARKGEIRISGKREDGMSIYCVADNGIGIEPNHQKKVFEIFHRLNPGDVVGGEGLGLTIVMRIVDRLNGRIWVESEAGKGSEFYVALPTV